MTTSPIATSSDPDPGALARARPGQTLLEIAIVFAPIPLMTLLVAVLPLNMWVAGSLEGLGIVLGMIVATIVLRRAASGWTDMGMGRPRSWLLTCALALAVIVATIVINAVLQVALASLLPAAEAPDHSRFDILRGNLPMLMLGLVSVWVTAAFGEEMLVRGFLMHRLAQLFGGSRGAWIASLLVSSVLFGLMHVYQGLAGVLLTGTAGFIFGAAYLLVRRNLWVTIIAHGLIDTLAFVAFYFGLVQTAG